MKTPSPHRLSSSTGANRFAGCQTRRRQVQWSVTLTSLLAVLVATSSARAISQGESLLFKGKWEAPTFDSSSKQWGAPVQTFPVNGVAIRIRDTAASNPAPDITGFIVGGEFSFTAPKDNFTFDVIVEASFPGVDAAGNVAPGGGAGAFTVKRGIVAADQKSTTQGPIYTFNLGQTLDHTFAETSNLSGFFSASQGDVMSALHGMADMVREARRQLDVAKTAFDVTIPADFTYFTGTGIFMLRQDRYDWDVVAHEFGHAIGKEESAEDPNASPGGGHDGSNQYDYFNADGNTNGDKAKSIGLAYSEGFGTWFGGMLLERSSFKGTMSNVGDGQYTDTEDGSGVGQAYDDSTTSTGAYGDDTEQALYRLFWDLHDARNEANTRTAAKVAGLSDRTALEISGVWKIFKGSSGKSIADFWKKGFLPNEQLSEILPAGPGDSVNSVEGLRKALRAAETFAEFGVAPVLFNPAKGDKLDLSAPPSDPKPKFEWDQLATGATNDLKLNKFKLAVYSGDYSRLLFRKDVNARQYELTQADLDAIKATVESLKSAGQEFATAVAVVVGESDTVAPTTGPYLSNGVELLLQDFNRAVVAVVDSSGSNTSTDPGDLRVVAAQESLRHLVSKSEAQSSGKTPDIAAAVDFDSSARTLHGFADPDVVIPSLSAIDSSGGTSIDGGINLGVSLLDGVTSGPGALGLFNDRAALVVFTDGDNNNGPAPVISAIVAATAKGVRVHYGFLQPFFLPPPLPTGAAPQSGPGEPVAGALPAPPALPPPGAPTTIQEAVLQSGGVFAVISDAESQVAFINQIYDRGITNGDGDNNSGGALVGQTNTSEQLTAENTIKAYDFRGKKDEAASVIVKSQAFMPNVTIFDENGAILNSGVDQDRDGRVTLPLTLPYTGRYTVQVFAEDDKQGLFTVFVDVENPPVGTVPDIASVGAPVVDRQTGLIRQTLTLTGPAGGASAFRLVVQGLPAGTTLHNASGANDAGLPFVQVDQPLAGNETLTIVLEYYSPTLGAPSPTFAFESAATVLEPAGGTPFAIDRVVDLGAGRGMLLEFTTMVGGRYGVQFSADNVTWKTSGLPMTAGGTRLQWIDSGPPKTPSLPGPGSRFYRAVRY